MFCLFVLLVSRVVFSPILFGFLRCFYCVRFDCFVNASFTVSLTYSLLFSCIMFVLCPFDRPFNGSLRVLCVLSDCEVSLFHSVRSVFCFIVLVIFSAVFLFLHGSPWLLTIEVTATSDKS